MNNMNFKIPFYGKKGTIKDIKEDAKYYIVYRYGLSEDEEIVFYVPKNDNNLSLLMDNYNSDLKGYLDMNANKYETFKKTRLNRKINMNTVKAMLAVSSVMLLSSIPLINTHEEIGFFGVILDTIAIPTVIYAAGEFVKKIDDDKKAKFVNSYNQMNHKYKNNIKRYNQEKDETKYKGLANDESKKPVVDLTKVKKLKQERNAA